MYADFTTLSVNHEEIPFPCGHLSLTCISVGPIVAQFLANPASVTSQTLKDPSPH
jgi:hypothetical protein